MRNFDRRCRWIVTDDGEDAVIGTWIGSSADVSSRPPPAFWIGTYSGDER